ncbi:2OG-Fe(II) oxygenase [Kaistia dalseonensis]|uniref:SM-20-related protein n=1 Tax=Kaistia dalseonensis TaxID=410840 RepID=A0ABU0HAR4_9HYPH|nr:2OG-Fe(II) oxygenase [Kaistia dalseonensis]MCX5496456.1 2OG-Fe(II) oxygenase [Kaistia dalseonensis]MDQ0439077.1 SM-20-related protein [Kaistia dalseonensis]
MSAFAEDAATLDDEATSRLVDRLATQGFAVADGLLPPALVAGLLSELHGLEQAGLLSGAGVGRDAGLRRDGDIRRAAIRWFDGGTAAERAFLALADGLKTAINRRLFLGLFDFECNFIAYPVGGFYGRHLDSLAGAKNRVVSLVAYLDPDWSAEDGGFLRVWSAPDDHGAPAEAIQPMAGRIVLMLSEEIPHEVLPAHRPRHAIAGWWRVNGSSANRLDPAR